MSAIRRIDRRAARKIQSSPYTRQTASKKSSWSISGLLSFFNPLRSKSLTVDDIHQDEPEDLSPVSDDDVTMAETFSARDRQLPHDFNLHGSPNVTAESSVSNMSESFPPTQSPTFAAPTTPPQANINFSLNDSSPSPAKNLETVAAFLTQKAGQPLNEVEAEGLVSLIQKSTQNDGKPEPFRFSSSTPSTPGRGNSPNSDLTTPDLPDGANSQSPRKTLSKNPNGIYRWEGGGSARPRNRFRSPAFGLPRSPASNIKLSPLEIPKTDTKRRRVGEEADSSSSQKVPVASTSDIRSSAPSPARHTESPLPFPVSNGAPSATGTLSPLKTNGASTPRTRLAALPSKPTVPAVPSPLRQAWGQTDSSSPPQPAPSSRPTKAANFMQELIKEVTPPKKPDVSNPYQTASPVKPSMKKPIKRTRATGKPSAPPQQKDPEPSPQAIIEATVPKGSKRSRPPTNSEGIPRRSVTVEEIEDEDMPPPSASKRSRLPEGIPRRPVTVEEVGDEDMPPPSSTSKRSRPPEGIPRRPVTIEEVKDESMPPPFTTSKPSRPPANPEGIHRPVTVEEVEDEDIPTGLSETHNTKSSLPNGFSPSDSSGALASSTRPSLGGKFSAPKEPSKLRFSYQPDTSSATRTPPPSQFVQVVQEKEKATEKQVKLDPKDAALVMDVDALPKFSFVFRESSNLAGPGDIASKAARTALVSSLPTFDFSEIRKPNADASTTVKTPTPAAVTFNWAAAGIAAPSKSNGASWTCSTCMLANPATAIDKCTVCDMPR